MPWQKNKTRCKVFAKGGQRCCKWHVTNANPAIFWQRYLLFDRLLCIRQQSSRSFVGQQLVHHVHVVQEAYNRYMIYDDICIHIEKMEIVSLQANWLPPQRQKRIRSTLLQVACDQCKSCNLLHNAIFCSIDFCAYAWNHKALLLCESTFSSCSCCLSKPTFHLLYARWKIRYYWLVV
jgi:hypothetical protein